MQEPFFLAIHIWCFTIQIWVWRKCAFNKFKKMWKVSETKLKVLIAISPQILITQIKSSISSLFLQISHRQLAAAACHCCFLFSSTETSLTTVFCNLCFALVRHLMHALAVKGWLGEREPSFLITHCYSQSRALSAEAPFGPLPPVPGLLWVNSLINNQAN